MSTPAQSAAAHPKRLSLMIAFVLFVLAALGGFHLLIHTSALHVLGLIATGLALLALSALD